MAVACLLMQLTLECSSQGLPDFSLIQTCTKLNIASYGFSLISIFPLPQQESSSLTKERKNRPSTHSTWHLNSCWSREISQANGLDVDVDFFISIIITVAACCSIDRNFLFMNFSNWKVDGIVLRNVERNQVRSIANWSRLMFFGLIQLSKLINLLFFDLIQFLDRGSRFQKLWNFSHLIFNHML